MAEQRESWTYLVYQQVAAGMVKTEHFEAVLRELRSVVGLQQLK